VFETQLGEAGIFGRARCSIYRSVAFRERHYFREVAYEREEFAESPDTAMFEIRIDGSSVYKGSLSLSRSNGEVKGIPNVQQIAASRAGIDPLINAISFFASWFDTEKMSV